MWEVCSRRSGDLLGCSPAGCYCMSRLSESVDEMRIAFWRCLGGWCAGTIEHEGMTGACHGVIATLQLDLRGGDGSSLARARCTALALVRLINARQQGQEDSLFPTRRISDSRETRLDGVQREGTNTSIAGRKVGGPELMGPSQRRVGDRRSQYCQGMCLGTMFCPTRSRPSERTRRWYYT